MTIGHNSHRRYPKPLGREKPHSGSPSEMLNLPSCGGLGNYGLGGAESKPGLRSGRANRSENADWSRIVGVRTYFDPVRLLDRNDELPIYFQNFSLVWKISLQPTMTCIYSNHIHCIPKYQQFLYANNLRRPGRSRVAVNSRPYPQFKLA